VDRINQVRARRPVGLVRVGIEAAGHYHRPHQHRGAPGRLAGRGAQPRPRHVTARRRVNGQRGVKTDPTDLVAICDLLLAGRGSHCRRAQTRP
jgi:hypothetical protein